MRFQISEDRLGDYFMSLFIRMSIITRFDLQFNIIFPFKIGKYVQGSNFLFIEEFWTII